MRFALSGRSRVVSSGSIVHVEFPACRQHRRSLVTALFTLMNAFKQLISDGSEGLPPSTMRVAQLAVVLPFMVVWTALSLKQGEMIIPDTRLVVMVAAAFGGKAAQSLFENFTGIHFSLPNVGATPALPGFPAPNLNPPASGSGAPGNPATAPNT